MKGEFQMKTKSYSEVKDKYYQDVKSFLKYFLENLMDEERMTYLHNEPYDKGNGYYERDLLTAYGNIEGLEVPRVRSGGFRPYILPYRRRAWFDIEDIVYAMHMTGSSIRDIKRFIEKVYSAYYSADAISRLTDIAEGVIEQWKRRPVEEKYIVVMIDCVFVPVRRGEVKREAVYIVMGINPEGSREIIGYYIFGSEGENSTAWKTVLEDIRQRGVQEVEVFVSDNLPGIIEETQAVYSSSRHQLCVVHQVRNSLLYVRNKDKSAIIDDMRKIYCAQTKEQAMEAFVHFKRIWQTRYPKVVVSWERNLPYLLTFYDFPEEIRKYIYTTNQIERINKEIKRRIKVIEVITGEHTLNKILYYVITEVNEKFKQRRLPNFAKYFSGG